MKVEADIAASQMKIRVHFCTLLHLMDGKDLLGSLSRYVCKYRLYVCKNRLSGWYLNLSPYDSFQMFRVMIDAQNEDAKTPLHFAIETGNIE